MRIFFIPSWYPSPDSPLTGIFFRDQAYAITTLYPTHCVGISNWGQNDKRLLLWAKQPFQSMAKFLKKPASSIIHHKTNLIEFFQPTYTWSKRIFEGNLQNIIQANDKNLVDFQHLVGKADIIHAHVGFPAGYIARILSEKYAIPYVITEQMSPFPFPYFLEGGKLMPKLELAYEGAKKNIAISHSLLKDMAAQNIQRLAYIPNLIDEDFFKPSEHIHSKNEMQTMNFFMLGRMVAQKGVPILLEAVKILIQKYPNIHFRLGGEGEDKLAYQKNAEKLGITAHLTWLGELSRQEALTEFQNCQVFVLPSLHETMGVVLAEALACGKPIVSTYCGGAESVVNAQNGLLARVGEPNDLAEKISQMIERIAQYPPEVCRQDAMNRFSKKVIVDQLLKSYEL